VFLSRTEADFQAWRHQEAWTVEKYRQFDRGERTPHDWQKALADRANQWPAISGIQRPVKPLGMMGNFWLSAEPITAGASTGRKMVMSRPSIVSLAATVIIGSACIVTISNDASAYSSTGIPIYQPGADRGSVYRGGGYRGSYYRGGYYRGAAGAAATIGKGKARNR
jgi:hypothetical protein